MVTHENWLRDIFRLIVWYPLRWLIGISPVNFAFAIFRQMGRLHYLSSGNKCNAVAGNMALALGNGSFNKKLVQQYFETHYINQLFVFLLPKFDKHNIKGIHVFQNLEILEAELSKKRGCILLHAHFGPVHLPLFHFALKGFPVMQVGYLREPENLSFIGKKVSFRLREKCEQIIPASIIQANRFLRPAFEHLKNNGLLMMTGDGAGRGEFIGRFEPFSFLGKKMLFPIGPFVLASKTDSDIIPVFTIKNSSGTGYITIIEKPILVGKTEKDYSMHIANTAKFVKIFESYVKEYPYHWHFWDEFSKGMLVI